MKRFITIIAVALLLFARICAQAPSSYSIVILGDTHYDTEPASVYHSHYIEKVEWLNKVQRAEFARNGEMWRERCPRLMERASQLIEKDTRMVIQLGDLIQGDCGNGEVHQQMLDDAMNNFKKQLGNLPLVTVVGNHDIRGTDAEAAYRSYMPKRMSAELGQKIEKTTFAFWIGKDAYIVVDFNKPDDQEIERLLEETKLARYTFVIIHGTLLPPDENSCRWFFHGKEKEREKRLHFRRLFAQRNVICLCGHTHRTGIADWWGDGGRITQFNANSVWSKKRQGEYTILSQGPETYGEMRMNYKNDDGTPIKDESALFEEYRPGLKTYINSPSAGSYRMKVSKRGVTIDFYAGDSQKPSAHFVIRGK